MAFGDAWGHDGRTYDGKEMRQHTEALTGGQTGVNARDALKVQAQVSPTNTVRVGPGQVIVKATGTGLFGSYEVPNDADLNSPAFTGTGVDPRTDRLIVRVTGGVPALEIVAGTPGPGTPPPPTVTGDNFEVLARIEIPASTSTITNAMIKDERKVFGPPLSHFASGALPAPSTVPVGALNHEPDTNRLRFNNGTAWQPVSGASAKVVLSADEVISDGVSTNIPWDAEDDDDHNMWSAGDPTKLTAPWTGIYLATTTTRWASMNLGFFRRTAIMHNGTMKDQTTNQLDNTADTNPLTQNCTSRLDMTAGQFAQVQVLHDAGANRSIETVVSNFSLTYLGPG